jgi:hypothetical protein
LRRDDKLLLKRGVYIGCRQKSRDLKMIYVFCASRLSERAPKNKIMDCKRQPLARGRCAFLSMSINEF